MAKEIEGRNGGTLSLVEKGDPPRNPAGPGRGYVQTKTIVRKWLNAIEKAKNPITGKEEELTQKDIITLMQLVKARKGDTVAFNALLDREDGKPKQFSEVSVSDKSPDTIDYSKLPTEVLEAILAARVMTEPELLVQNENGIYESQ